VPSPNGLKERYALGALRLRSSPAGFETENYPQIFRLKAESSSSYIEGRMGSALSLLPVAAEIVPAVRP